MTRSGSTDPVGDRHGLTVSVLIVSYDTSDLLRRCLASLADADEIVVVDNGSSDGSVEMARHEFPDVVLVASGVNRGFGAGVNEAARHATSDCFLLLNPDAQIGPGSLPQMVELLAQRPGAGAIGFRQVDAAGVFQLSFGPAPSLLLEFVRMVVQRRLDRGDVRLARFIDHCFSRPCRVPWVTGSSLLLRREAFEAVGGFDEGYFLYFEDADVCQRLSSRVGPIWYDPTVTVVHHRGASAVGRRREVMRHYRASQRRYWQQHGGRISAWLVDRYLGRRRCRR